MKQNKWGFTLQQLPSLGTHVVLTLTESLLFLDHCGRGWNLKVLMFQSHWEFEVFSSTKVTQGTTHWTPTIAYISFNCWNPLLWNGKTLAFSRVSTIILVGNPDQTVSTGVRSQHGGIVCNDKIVALVHDFHVAGIVSSVCYNVSIPESIHNSFYRGSVHVTVKDNVFEPSSPLDIQFSYSMSIYNV